MKKAIRVAVMSTALMLMGAPLFAADPPANAAAQDSSTPKAASLTSRGSMSEHDFDNHFVMHAIGDNTTEIQLAKIVAEKTQDPQVKQFAQMLVQDHTKAVTELRDLAQQKGFTIPAQTNELETAKIAMAEKSSGPDLDRHFVFGMVGGHVTNILAYRNADELATDPQLKQWIEQTVPVLREHLRMAKELAGGGPEETTAGAHLEGNKITKEGNPAIENNK